MICLDTAISDSRSFLELANLTRYIKENISFFGRRYIYLSGYQSHAALDSLAIKVRALAFENLGFSEEERAWGHEVGEHIDRLYQESDERLENMNILTVAMCTIREFFNRYIFSNGLDARYLWFMYSPSPSLLFDQLTTDQYRQRYGQEPLEEECTIIIRQGRQIQICGPVSERNNPYNSSLVGH